MKKTSIICEFCEESIKDNVIPITVSIHGSYNNMITGEFCSPDCAVNFVKAKAAEIYDIANDRDKIKTSYIAWIIPKDHNLSENQISGIIDKAFDTFGGLHSKPEVEKGIATVSDGMFRRSV